jgi:hypothetical protein
LTWLMSFCAVCVQRRSLFLLRILYWTLHVSACPSSGVQVITVKGSAAHCHAVFFPPIQWASSRDSSVGIVTAYGLNDRGVGVRVSIGSRIFSFFCISRPALRPTQPPIEWVPGFPRGVKRPERETDHSPPNSGKVNKMWIYTATPHTPSWHSA